MFSKGLLTQAAQLIKAAPLPGRPHCSHHCSPCVLPQIWGGLLSPVHKKLVCSHLFTKKYLMDPGQGTVRKQVKSMGMITNRCDNHLTCLCHSSSAVSWWCPAWLRSSGDPEPTCIRLQSSSFGYNPALCFSV